jgi:VWFA-related protein
MKKRVLVCAAIAALLSPGYGYTQEKPFSETVEVTVVEVPVTVVDRAGNSVRGLKKEDFEVTDDGKKVNLIGFETIDLSKITPTDNATPAPPAAYRNFLLLFDLANSSRGTVGRAQKAAREFVAGQLGHRDLAAVATLSVEHGLQVVTSFTSDRATLEHAVATLGVPKYFKVADPLRIAPPPSQAQSGGERKVDAGADIAVQNLLEMMEATQRVNEQEQRGRLRKQFNQLSGVARMLDALRGQKQIILLSEGFDPKLVQGRQDLSAGATQKENDAVLTGEIWNVDSDTRFGSSTSSSEIGAMAEIFRRSDVTLHAIDIKGLRSDVDASEGVKKSSNEALYLLTRPTGGAVFKNASSLSESFGQLLKQQEIVYVLAFESKGQKEGKFHPVKVKVPSARGARVNARAGYYESSPRSSPLEQTLSLADIMMTDADVREVPLALFSMPLPAKSGGARLPLFLEIPGAGLLEKVTGTSATATLFVYAFDEQYQIKDYLQQRVGFDLAKSGAQLRASGMRYVAMLALPPGKYAVKALVRVEESGRIGFLRTDVVVPATSGPAVLPPVFVNERPGWINIPAPGTGASAMATFTAAGKAFVPSRGPSLKNDGAYRVALFVQDTPAENLEISPLVISSDGTSQPALVSLVGRTPPDSEGAAKVLLEFKPPKMAAGEYSLQFTVKPKDGASSVVAVPFRME